LKVVVKVDLWRLDSGSMLLEVLGVATAGIVSCDGSCSGPTLGESLSIAVAMNARTMGSGRDDRLVARDLEPGRWRSIVVMVAVTTSFMAPVARLTMRMVG
jgi:hypothetical protein